VLQFLKDCAQSRGSNYMLWLFSKLQMTNKCILRSLEPWDRKDRKAIVEKNNAFAFIALLNVPWRAILDAWYEHVHQKAVNNT